MAQYNGMIFTKKGRNLLAKAEAGATLNFTKVKLGDGQLASGQSLENLNDLVHPLKTLGIVSIIPKDDGTCTVRSVLSNEGLTEGFYVREVGLFAQDPDLGEILFGITTAVNADYLPPDTSTTAVTSQFDIVVIVANAANVTATIANSGYVLATEFNSHKDNTTLHITAAERTKWNEIENVDQKINQAITDLINGAPGALDTLKELADAMGDDPNFATTILNRITEVEQNAATHSADTTKHITAAERAAWNSAEANAKAYTDTAPEAMQRNIGVFSIYKSGKDANGIFTTVDYKRPSGTLYARSVLSGGTSPQYTTRTITYYSSDGVTVVKTDTFILTYDANGDLISEVKQ